MIAWRNCLNGKKPTQSLLRYISFLFFWHWNIKQLIKRLSLSCLKPLLVVDKGIYCQQEQSTFFKLFLHSLYTDRQIICMWCAHVISSCSLVLTVLHRFITTLSAAYRNLATKQHLPKPHHATSLLPVVKRCKKWGEPSFDSQQTV